MGRDLVQPPDQMPGHSRYMCHRLSVSSRVIGTTLGTGAPGVTLPQNDNCTYYLPCVDFRDNNKSTY
jgi:hypothetical protein